MKPTNKVTAGILAGALAAIGVWAAKQWGKVDVPTEVAMSAQVVFTFAVQWLVPDAEA